MSFLRNLDVDHFLGTIHNLQTFPIFTTYCLIYARAVSFLLVRYKHNHLK